MRLQLAWPGLHIVPPETFNRLFTMHGTTMVFLVGIPIVFGFGNYLVPLMIGARDLAFPRLNAFGFWIFLFGGLLLLLQLLGGEGLYGAGSAPAVGWFAYAPLTSRAFTPRQRHRLLEPGDPARGRRHHRDRDQPGRHHPDDAGPGHDARPHADLRVDDADGVRDDPVHPAAAVGGPDHAAARPLPRRALLRHAGRRVGRDVAALLLVLRPPRGLRPDGAGLRLRLRDHPGVLAQGDLRLRDSGGRHGRHRRRRPGRLGPPHVRGGHGEHR